VWHPILAVAVAGYLFWIAWRHADFAGEAQATPRQLVMMLIAGQCVLGMINLLLLAPLSLQMAHLLGSNLLWIALVWAYLNRQSGIGNR
jgi:heme A synthase